MQGPDSQMHLTEPPNNSDATEMPTWMPSCSQQDPECHQGCDLISQGEGSQTVRTVQHSSTVEPVTEQGQL